MVQRLTRISRYLAAQGSELFALASAPCSDGRTDGGRLGDVREVIYTQTTAEPPPDRNRAAGLTCGTSAAGASLRSAPLSQPITPARQQQPLSHDGIMSGMRKQTRARARDVDTFESGTCFFKAT